MRKAEPAPILVGSRHRGRVHITQQNNHQYWDGALPGTTRWGYKWSPATIRVTAITEEFIHGSVQITGQVLHVRRPAASTRDEWEIVGLIAPVQPSEA